MARPGGGWDTLVIGNMRYDNQNTWNYYGGMVSGPYGTWWQSSGFTSITVGPATNPTGLYNLCLTFANLYGRVVC